MTKDLIKVHYKGPECWEHLWAKPLKNKTARLENIPFQGEISLHDIVQLDDELNITKVIEKKTNRAGIKYRVNKKTIKEQWKKMVKYFEKNKIQIEGTVIGYASLAVPLSMKKKTFIGIVKKSPLKVLNYYSGEIIK